MNIAGLNSSNSPVDVRPPSVWPRFSPLTAKAMVSLLPGAHTRATKKQYHWRLQAQSERPRRRQGLTLLWDSVSPSVKWEVVLDDHEEPFKS